MTESIKDSGSDLARRRAITVRRQGVVVKLPLGHTTIKTRTNEPRFDTAGLSYTVKRRGSMLHFVDPVTGSSMRTTGPCHDGPRLTVSVPYAWRYRA